MKKLLIMAVAACCLAACNKELGPEYKVAPVISNVSCSPGLDMNNYIIEVFTGSLGTDQIVLRIGSTRRDEAFEKEIKDTFRSKVRVAPEVVFEQVEYIAKKQMPQMSRKQIKFVDLREQTK